MLIPGSNLLAMALRVINPQSFLYFFSKDRSLNEIGVFESKFGNGVPLSGSVQPVPRSLYQQNGLDFQKNYYMIYVSKDVIDVERDVSGDQIEYKGMRMQCISKTDWFTMDGWDSVLAVEIPAVVKEAGKC